MLAKKGVETASEAQIAAKAMEGSGFRGMGTGDKTFCSNSASSSLLEGAEEPEVKPPFTEEDYKEAYEETS